MIAQIRSMLEHAAWADSRALEALRRGEKGSERALALYAHVLGAERLWFDRLEGRAASVDVWPTLTLDECAELAERNVTDYAAFVTRLDEEGLNHTVTYHNSAGAQFTSRVDDILLHVALHGAYHRGQVALVQRDGGEEPSPTDYIAFIRGAPAATRSLKS